MATPPPPQVKDATKGYTFLVHITTEFMGRLFQVAEEVLAMSISLQPEEIRDLARQINETIRGLTDIDTILAETKDDLERANDLKRRAGAAK